MNLPLILATLALTTAGAVVWIGGCAHGYRAGLQWNRDVIRADARLIVELRGQVAILEAGMLRAPVDLWADFDRSGS